MVNGYLIAREFDRIYFHPRPYRFPTAALLRRTFEPENMFGGMGTGVVRSKYVSVVPNALSLLPYSLQNPESRSMIEPPSLLVSLSRTWAVT